MLSRIEAYRASITAALTRTETEREPDYTVYPALPPDFYSPRQLERYLRTDDLLTRTTSEFMREIGVQTYRLEREFRIAPRWPWGTWKDMYYRLVFGEKQGFDNAKGDTLIEYNPGGPMVPEFLRAHCQSTLLTPKRRHDLQVSAREAVQFLQSEEAVRVRDDADVILYPIDLEGIRDLLTVIVSNPKLDLSALKLR